MPSPSVALVPFVSLAVFAPSPAARRPTARPDTTPAAGCDSAALRQPVGWATDTLRLEMYDADGSGRALAAPWAALALQEFAARVVLPEPLTLPAWTPLRRRRAYLDASPPPDTVSTTVGGAVLVRFTPDGRVDGAPLVVATTLDARLDRALVAAVQAADSAQVIGPPPRSPRPPYVIVRLSVDGHRGGDPPTRAEQAADRVHRTRVPLRLVRRELFLATRYVRPRPTAAAEPEYPDVSRRAGVEGDVLVEFVVDPAGRVAAGTLAPQRYTPGLFLDAVTRALPATRYEPLRVAGCAVPALVAQPFAFRIGG